MKKSVFLLMLTMTFLISGCGKEAVQTSQTEPAMEVESAKDDDGNDLEEYIASVEAQSDMIKDFLENDAVTQSDMNEKSLELYELWDTALNDVWGELKVSLSEEEFAELLDEQRVWITEKENAVEEAGKEVEGGSLYPLVVNMEAATVTEERVRELYALLP